MWLIGGVLALTSLLLASRRQMPAAPVFVVAMGLIGAALWWLAVRGGRSRGRPVAAPLEALVLIGATMAALVVFWLLWDVLS